MKRSGELKRTALQRRTPMARKPFARRTGAEARARETTIFRPKRARAIPFPPKVAALLDARDEWCQRCGWPRDLERHHRRGKASGGSQNRCHAQCACNGVRLCTACHIWAHRHGRREAEAQGYVVSQSVDEPGRVSLMRGSADGGGAAMWPDCEGNWLSESPWTKEAA